MSLAGATCSINNALTDDDERIAVPVTHARWGAFDDFGFPLWTNKNEKTTGAPRTAIPSP